MFSSFGAAVTLVVSRQQVLPGKDPEVAAVLEDDFLRPRRQAAEGRPGDRHRARPRQRRRRRALRRRPRRAHRATPCWPSARSPTPTDLGLELAGVEVEPAGTCRSTTTASPTSAHIYAAGDVSGKLPLSSVAAMQGRKVAEHVMGLHTRRAPPPRLRQGGVGDLHRARDRRRRPRRGRGVRVGPQDPRHQGAVLGHRQGVDQQRHRRASSRSSPIRPPASCSAGRSSAATPPS